MPKKKRTLAKLAVTNKRSLCIVDIDELEEFELDRDDLYIEWLRFLADNTPGFIIDRFCADLERLLGKPVYKKFRELIGVKHGPKTHQEE